MPLFDVECSDCKAIEEVLVRSSGETLKCPKCNSLKVVKHMAPASFQLKGGGWASDLYSSPAPKPEPTKP